MIRNLAVRDVQPTLILIDPARDPPEFLPDAGFVDFFAVRPVGRAQG